MTPDQAENREHRVAYMIQDGDVTEEEAHAHCDKYPAEYGIREQILTQQDIFLSHASH